MLNSSIVLSQYLYRELSIYGSGGLSALSYQLSSSNISSGAGFDFGVGLSLFYTHSMALHTGAGFRRYSSKNTFINEKTVALGLKDSEDDIFDMHTTLLDYREKQNITLLNVPLMLLYHKKNTRAPLSNDGLFVMGGVKLGLPVSGKYKTHNGALTNEGFYPKMGEWATTQEFAGYGTFRDINSNGKLNLGISVMLSLEAGNTWRINKNISFYAGAYFDLCLNSIIRGKQQFIDYTNTHPAVFSTNSVMSLADNIRMMSSGLKLQLAFEKIEEKKRHRRRR